MAFSSQAEVPTPVSFGLWVRHCSLLLPLKGLPAKVVETGPREAQGQLEDTKLCWASLALLALSRAGRTNKWSFVLFSRDLAKGHRSIRSQRNDFS